MRFIIFITIIMSFLSFALYGIDKWKARHHRWRIPERVLLLFPLLMGGIGGLLGMIVFRHKTRKWVFRILIPVFAAVQVILLAFLLWAADYGHADPTALDAMKPTETVSVERTSGGWLFDGPSDENALVFYPGGKVEATAYAPLLRRIAEAGMDVYLEQMPLRLAFLGINRAGSILKSGSYERYYIGGHSLGGAMAAVYAAGHGEELNGVILLAAYPTKELDRNLTEILIYGSEDRVLNMDKVAEGDKYAPDHFIKNRIDGGNHAQFGNYGEQKGDGKARISAEDQQEATVHCIMDSLNRK